MTRSSGTPQARSAAARAAKAKASPDGVHRAARARTCRRCERPIFEGLDGDVCAMVVRVEPRPISAAGEVAALMTGRPTYSLTWIGGRGRYEIDPRTRTTIEAHPPGSAANSDVVVAHECGAPDLPGLRTTIIRKRNAPAAIDPPF